MPAPLLNLKEYEENYNPTHIDSSPAQSPSNSELSSPERESRRFRTNPEEHCQNCKNEVSEDLEVFLPTPPIQMRDFITECPTPWLHYNYCTPCLELARHSSTGTVITEHIAQCEALYGQCWDGQHEEHIAHYQHTEAGLKVKH